MRSSALEADAARNATSEYTAFHLSSALAASVNCAICGMGAADPSRHASSNARPTTEGTLSVVAIPTHLFNNSRMIAAASGPPVLATAATASAWALPWSCNQVLSTMSRKRSNASGTASKPIAKRASR